MNKVLDWISRIVCFGLCLILFFVFIIYLGLNTFTNVVSTDNITKIVTEVDIKDIIGEETINSMYENAEANEINRNIIDGLIEDKEFKALIGKVLGNSVEIALYGKEGPVITVDEIVSVLDKHIDGIAAEAGVVLSSEDRAIILQEVEVEAESIVESLSIEEDLQKELTVDEITMIRFIFGETLQTILLVAILLIMLFIALARWSIYRFAIWTGTTTTIVGGVFALLGFGFTTLIEQQSYFVVTPNLIQVLNQNVFGVITQAGLIVLAVGVIQIVYYVIMKKRQESTKV